MVNKVVFGSKLCSSFAPTHVVERFKTEIDAHAEAKADAANATDVAAETEAEEKVPLYLLLLPTATYCLPPTAYYITAPGTAHLQSPATLGDAGCNLVYLG